MIRNKIKLNIFNYKEKIYIFAAPKSDVRYDKLWDNLIISNLKRY